VRFRFEDIDVVCRGRDVLYRYIAGCPVCTCIRWDDPFTRAFRAVRTSAPIVVAVLLDFFVLFFLFVLYERIVRFDSSDLVPLPSRGWSIKVDWHVSLLF